MIHFFKFLIFLLLVQNLFGQTDSTINSLVINNEEEFQCDSIIDIEVFGSLNYKLIFKQTEFDINNKNLIVIPHTKISVNDNSILVSNHPKLSRTILKLDYDTCFVTNFTEKDNEREYSNFVKSPDTSKIHDWTVEIEYQGNHCIDTDHHFVRVKKDETNYINFSCLHNIQLFELDLNNDNMLEIYLISYIWCISEIRIYRIDK